MPGDQPVGRSEVDAAAGDRAQQGSCREVVLGEPVAGAGRWGTRLAQSVVRQVLAATGARVLPALQLYAAGAEALFDEEGKLIDAATRRQLVAVLAAFAEWIDLVGN